MSYVFPAPPQPAIPVLGSESLFPVNRIYCVGQNYSDHVKEMGGDPKKNPPVFFSKPANAIVTDNRPVHYPSATKELHHEVELVVALASGGRNIDVAAAERCIYGLAVGVDFTRRDLQAAAKQGGKPWDTAKGFDESAPISAIAPLGEGGIPKQAAISLAVNTEIRQQAELMDMIWSVPEILHELSQYYELKAGDLIFTGTPAGVSAVVAGDHIDATIAGIGQLNFDVVT
jgi:fumarylpyruvate hydrolase